MRTDSYTKAMLTVIALALGLLAVQPFLAPAPTYAQADRPEYYVEPGFTLLRKPGGTAQLWGKVVVDLKTGDIWGFPTGGRQPYPVDPAHTEPPVSSPMHLGRFDVSQMNSPR